MTYLCHCTTCQKRTGAGHAFNTWFRDEQISSQSGAAKVFEHANPKGAVRMEFCAECGSTVSWTSPNAPGGRSFAAGCFADLDFPTPQIEFFISRRKRWMSSVDGAAQFETQPNVE